MARFLVDENLPRSLATELIASGHEATHVRDVGLRGKPDREIIAYAVANTLTLISADVDFCDVREYPLGSHSGIVVVRLREEETIAERKRVVVRVVSRLMETELFGSLIVIDPGGVRVRRWAGHEGRRT